MRLPDGPGSHFFMAAQALEEAAVEAGYEVKIETQGADGIQIA